MAHLARYDTSETVDFKVKGRFDQLSFHVRRLLVRQERHADTGGKRLQYVGIHAHDSDGCFMHILVARPVRPLPAHQSEGDDPVED